MECSLHAGSVEWVDDSYWWMTHLKRTSAEVARSWHRAECQSWCRLLQCPLPSHYRRRPGASTTGKQQVSVHVRNQTDDFIRLKGWRQSVSIALKCIPSHERSIFHNYLQNDSLKMNALVMPLKPFNKYLSKV